jgi:hypothetical protein
LRRRSPPQASPFPSLPALLQPYYLAGYLSLPELLKSFMPFNREVQEKNRKFSVNDAKERSFWDDYMTVYEDMFNHTSTKYAPWYIIPADRKWFTRLVVAGIIYTQLKELNLKYPKVSKEQHQELLNAKEILESQKEG